MNLDDLEWTDIVIVFVTAATVVFLIAMGVRDCGKRRECESKGGRVEEYDCTTTVHCTTSNNGHGVSYTTCTPVRSCRWRCVGLPAEDPQ